MARRRLTTCLSLLLVLLCTVTAILGWLGVSLPERAQARFGPADPALGLVNRIYLSAQLLWYSDQLTSPANPTANEKEFQVPAGESTPVIISRLREAGLIEDPAALRAFLQYTGMDTSLQAGEYILSPAMTAIEIAHVLQDATPTEVNFHIFQGWRLEEIAAALPTSGLSIEPEELLQVGLIPPTGHPLTNEIPTGVSVEGFLMPGQYKLERDLSALGFINYLLDQFDQQVTEQLRAGFSSQGLSLYQAVTLASIVEREAIVDHEKPLIASVFLNRLVIGMKLDADPTVQYALGFQPGRGGWWTTPLTIQDLQIDSPYNTYLYKGLPPGPIGNPSLQALQAVANPADTSYYYFRAACDGSGQHLFAETFEGHLNNACQ